jgi:hypothetical protein
MGPSNQLLSNFKMTLHGMETSDMLEVLELSSDDKLCNYDSGSNVDISESE